MKDLVARACKAYSKLGGVAEPSNSSSVEEHDGKKYVVLRNVNGVLAVYRLGTGGSLRRLKRWPSELD